MTFLDNREPVQSAGFQWAQWAEFRLYGQVRGGYAQWT